MKRLFKGLIFSLLMAFSSVQLTGCMGFTDDETLVIVDIQTQTLENGNIQVEITYNDETIPPTKFIIPKGEKGDIGEAGLGIKEVTNTPKEDGTGSTLTITYTDDSIEPLVLDVKDGVSVTNIESLYDEETGETTVIVKYSDGTESEPIVIPAGKNGQDGRGIVEINQRINRDFSVTLTLVMSDEDEIEVTIPPAERGEDGRGIKDIVSIPNGDKYVMTITYDDEEETKQELEFARPNKWFSEMALPTSDDGINGDLWYDLAHNTIYVKQNNYWSPVIDLNTITEKTCDVTFNLNDTNDEPASMPKGSLITYKIQFGMYFQSSKYNIPVPTREGYEFAGWYTVIDPTVVNGVFTDLTSVHDDLTLYAKWEPLQ